MLASVDWRTVALAMVALGQTLFVFLYMTFPWYTTFLGRALFYKASIMMILVDAYFVARVFHFANLDTFFIWLYFLLGTAVWGQFFAFLKVRTEGRQHPGRQPGHEPDAHQSGRH